LSSFKPAGNPFLSVKKAENRQTISSLFSTAKAEDKLITSGVFSAIPSSTKASGNALLSFSSKPDLLFQKTDSRNLFGPAPVSTNKFDLFSKGSQPTTGGLFSANSQSIAFQKIPDDPIKKRAMLFLNKLGSDVVFKVEDQEFPAHKDILSEKCRFFKNMFSSIFCLLKSQVDFIKVECLSHTHLSLKLLTQKHQCSKVPHKCFQMKNFIQAFFNTCT